MKSPLYSLIVLSMFCFNFSMALSQPPEGYSAEKVAEGQTRWMTKQLTLNDSVKNLVYQINLKCIKQVDSVRISNTELEDKRTIYFSIYKDKNAVLQRVLTPAQYSTYILMLENVRKVSSGN